MPRHAIPQACHCGCGDWTNGGNFRPGHDARLRGDLLRAYRSWNGGIVRGRIMSSSDAERELSSRHWLPSQHGATRPGGTNDRRRDYFNRVSTHISSNRSARAEITIPNNPVDQAISELRDAPAERTFGVEMEFFGVTPQVVIAAFQAAGLNCSYEGYNHQARSHWKIVTDASVNRTGTGVHSGLELVSPILAGEAGYTELARACEALTAAGAKVDRTCGVHVHLGADDLDAASIARIAANYAFAQRHIDSLLPASRRSTARNIYCMAMPTDIISRLIRAGEQGQTRRQMAYEPGTRYFAVNLESLTRHGTVEFRQHSGSTEAGKLTAWVRLMQAIVTTSRTQTILGTDSFQSWTEALGLSDELRDTLLARREQVVQAEARRAARAAAGSRGFRDMVAGAL